jgi:soluble lytic murein transglycosylase
LKEALEILKTLENSSLKMRALYWSGKISRLLGEEDNAAKLLKIAADNFPPTYYSTLAEKILNPEVSGLRTISKTNIVPIAFQQNKIQREQTGANESSQIERTQTLLKLGLNELALKELSSIDRRQDPMLVSLLYKEAGDIYRSYTIARDYIGYSDLSYQLLFPEGYKEKVEHAARESKIDPLLMYAIIRHESEFDAKAVSRAGAVGLLQIMPSTGRMIARELSHNPFQEDSLFEPVVSINFGAWYIKTLIKKFNGSLPLAIAAYNAGPNAVNEWLKKWDGADMDEFIENIPYQETRKYVEKVLGNYEAYKAVYASPSQIQLNTQSADSNN